MGAFDIASIGENAANNVVGAAMGLALEKHNDKRQLRQQDKLNANQYKYNAAAAQLSQDLQYEMWKKTNYSAQMEELKKAGLNPALMYGMGGGGGSTTGSAGAAGVSGGAATAGGGEIMGMMGNLNEQRLLKAQAENIEADTALKRAEIPTEGAKQGNLNADTENKILSSILLEYAGKEAADQYNYIKQPNRGIEADMYQKEMEARIGVAGTIYELWTEGKLKEKGMNEIEAIALGNAKSREERKKISKEIDLLEANLKGKNLENMITELEAKLQKETGIDRNSPTWLKILGRLFVGIGGTKTLDAMQ